jgi:hypothetical protein
MTTPPANIGDINRELAKFFTNGRGEAGLEVGADPGLPFDQRIKIPASMKRRWAYRIASTPPDPIPEEQDLDRLVASDGYEMGSGEGRAIVCLGGAYFVTSRPSNTQTWQTVRHRLPAVGDAPSDLEQTQAVARHIDDIRYAPGNLQQIAEFIEVNTAAAAAAAIQNNQLAMVHAARYWGTVAGWVTTSKNTEYEEVATPASISADAWQLAITVAGMPGEAFTACAARGASWRKTNHCTGGDMAQGLPRRWLDKNGHWGSGNDDAQTRAMHRASTSAFYFATHAVSNHGILAALAPTDPGHWSRLNPDYGCIIKWEPGESVTLRIAQMTQVAGAAIVADSVEVLRMVIKERLSPLVNARDNIAALMTAYETVRDGGIAVHVGARWFLDGHPSRNAPQAFSQKDSAHFSLAAELAVVATTYYARTTIGRSMALKNAAEQCSDEQAKSTWTSLASNRAALAAQEVIKAVARIKGAASVGAVKDMVSESESKIRTAVGAYNAALRNDATLVGITANLDLDEGRIVDNAKEAARNSGASLSA